MRRPAGRGKPLVTMRNGSPPVCISTVVIVLFGAKRVTIWIFAERPHKPLPQAGRGKRRSLRRDDLARGLVVPDWRAVGVRQLVDIMLHEMILGTGDNRRQRQISVARPGRIVLHALHDATI